MGRDGEMDEEGWGGGGRGKREDGRRKKRKRERNDKQKKMAGKRSFTDPVLLHSLGTVNRKPT